MTAYRQNAANAYANVGFETGITAASPHQLITLLFDGALTAIANARQLTEAQDIIGKGEAINKATLIIDSGLRAALNLEQGGELAKNLDDLYQYMLKRLVEAHLHNKLEFLDEVTQLLNDIKSAWATLDPQTAVDESASQANASIHVAG